MQNIQNLQRICKTLSGGNYNGVQWQYAFGFDWVNDYIAWDSIIGRTGYDATISWNVSTSSDSDGSYIWFNWNRDDTAVTGIRAEWTIWTTPSFTQATSFSIKARAKAPTLPTSLHWLFWSNQDFAIDINNSNVRFTVRWSSTITNAYAISAATLYDFYLVYNASDAKFYCYINGVLQNVWGTAWPATFSTDAWRLWDNAVGGWNIKSAEAYLYHAAIRNVALTQAEIDADIALGNTAKSDPRIVAYYIPENLQYNTDYITTKDFTNASWTKTGTVVTGWQADLRWGTSAALLTISAWAWNWVTLINNTITGSTIASRTFKMKMFAWTTAGSATVRLKIVHNGVATYYSSDLTVTTTPQEFTFTQTLTSSTSGTWVTYGIEVWSGAWAATIVAYYPTDWIADQTLRDESPNIGGYIGWKTPLVMSAWVRPDIDSAGNATKQVFFQLPWHYLQLRNTSNTTQFRSETTLEARVAATSALWSWFRNKVHILWCKVRDWTWRLYKSYVNWQPVAWSQSAYTTTVRPASTIYRTNASLWFYTTDYRDGDIRDARAYTFTWSFTDADAETIYKGWDPAWLTKYLNWRPMVGESGNTVLDYSGNSRNGTLTWWAYRTFVPN